VECGFGHERVILAGRAWVSNFGWRGHFQWGAGVWESDGMALGYLLVSSR